MKGPSGDYTLYLLTTLLRLLNHISILNYSAQALENRLQIPDSFLAERLRHDKTHPVPRATAPFMARDEEMALPKSLAYRVFSGSKSAVKA